MQMTEQEICKEYREAKDPNRQLTILAQLNTCEPGDILAILEKNGEPLKKRPYQRNPKPEKEATKKEEEIPASVFRAIQDRIVWLKVRAGQCRVELNETQKECAQLESFMRKHMKKPQESGQAKEIKNEEIHNS